MNSRVANVTTAGNGGGVSLVNVNATFTDTVLENNTADLGGAMYAFRSEVVFVGGTVRANTANLGGGIYLLVGATLSVQPRPWSAFLPRRAAFERPGSLRSPRTEPG